MNHYCFFLKLFDKFIFDYKQPKNGNMKNVAFGTELCK